MSQALTNAPSLPAPLSEAEINAWLDYAMEQMIARRAEVIAGLKATEAAYPTIDDDEALAIAAENTKMATALLRVSKDRFTQEKAPFLNGGRTVDAWFKKFNDVLNAAIAPVQKVMDDYGARKLANVRAEQEAERRRKQAEADEAAEAARKAMERDAPDTDAKLERAADTAAAVEKVEAKQAQGAAASTRTRGMYGAVASVRSKWSWELTDINLVPHAYFSLDPEKVKAAANRDGRDPVTNRPLAVVPGIKWIEETKIGNPLMQMGRACQALYAKRKRAERQILQQKEPSQ